MCLAEIEMKGMAYQQKCIVGTIQFEGNLNATAWQRFLSTGPIGLLPLAPGYCSLAWSASRSYAEKIIEMDDETFIKTLNEAIQHRLGKILHVGTRKAFPLAAQHAKTYIAPRIALLGNAAHNIHPLAGLGANIGFQDVAAMHSLLLKAQSDNSDIGAPTLLKEYEQLRKSHNARIMTTMTAFNSAFSHNYKTLGKLCDLSLTIADKMTWAKPFLLKQAVWMQHKNINAL